MYKIYTKNWCVPPGRTRKLLLIMKLTVIIVIATLMNVSASTYAQRLTFTKNGATLSEVFNQINLQTGYNVLYSPDLINENTRVNANYKGTDLKQVLDQLIDKENYDYTIDRKNILITRAKEKSFLQKIVDAIAATKISGKIVDENGEVMPGATITVKGTKNAVIADANGTFSILADDKDILVFSFIGYEIQELRAGALKTPVVITLKPSLSNLDQVQVTAYGTTTKRLNTGNITTVTAQDIAKNPVNNVMEALQGKVPGLFIQQATGQPGGAFSIRIRNATNFASGANPPLIVVDGVRYPGSTLPLATNAVYSTQNFLQGGSGLNYINPNDIESIDVLKDIDATAIYGSSGAYGAIIITTKKAKQHAQAFNANVYSGVSVLGQMPKLLNTEQYVMLRKEAFANDNLPVSITDPDVNGTWPADRYTDFRKLFLSNAAVTSNANLSYSGGGQNSSYLISGSLRSFGNIQRHNGANNDGSVRFALNTNTADNKFSFLLSGTFLSSINDMVPYDFSARALTAPNAPSPFNDDGSINWNNGINELNSSGVASSFNRTYKNTTNNFLANATLIYRPTSKITLRSIFGYNDLAGKELIGYPSTIFNPTSTTAATQSVGLFHHYDTRSITISPYAEFNTQIGKKGDFSIKLGGEIGNSLTYFDEIQGTGFPSDALLQDPAAGSTILTNYNLTEYRNIGMYGIIKYVWDNKYIVDINTRRDGSTKFGPGLRFGNFGSAALAWIFTEEGFVKNNLPFLSFGKLRVSSGTVGGDGIKDFAYLGTYSVVSGTYDTKIGLSPNSLPNPSLNWEKNFKSEVGLELGFFKDRITTDFSYYYNLASNQLIGQPLSSVTGYTSFAINSDASIRTSGLEVSLTSANVKSKNFNWTTRFNISFPKSKLLKVPSQASATSNYVLDQPVTGVLLYKYNGVNPQTGYYSFTNAKGVTSDFISGMTQADKTEFIDLAPKYFGGLTNTFTYKRLTLDLTVNFTSSMGRNILGQTAISFGYYTQSNNGSDLWLRRWQKPGDVTDVPRVSTNLTSDLTRQTYLAASTGGYSDAKYARLQNASLRYSFGPKILQSLHLKNLAIYAQGQNLYTWSGFDGLDPENMNLSVIPPLRTFTFGLNLTL